MNCDGGFSHMQRIRSIPPALRILSVGVVAGACVALLAHVFSDSGDVGEVNTVILALFAFTLAALTGVAKTTTA